MPKGKDRKNLKLPQKKIALLLVQFILIKIGQIPYIMVRFLVYSLWLTVKSISRIRFPTFSLPKPKTPHISTIYHIRRQRGRPRKDWLLPYYLNKFKVYFRRRINKRTKISLAIFTILLLVFLYTNFILNAAYQLPSPDRLISPNQPLTTEFFDRNGKLLYRLYEGRNRSLATLDELPKYLIDATIAIEDKNFYRHIGIDLEAIIRALIHNVRNQEQEGASTITQQLIKNSLLTPEKTYVRKIKEVILALWAESKYSKQQILQMYFNETPYGGLTWGIKAASQTYFAKEPKDLTLAEASFLAGLPASPSQFSPYGTHPELGIERQKEVLRRMFEEKYITQAQEEEALNQTLSFLPPQDNIHAPHFVFYIKDILSQKYGPRVVSQGGLKIVTSLDLDLQEKVEKIVSDEVNNLNALNVKNGAALVTDPKTGQIWAMIGSKDYYALGFGNFNATIALRQPGSSIKPITYTTAFKQGFSPGNTILDAPTVFRDEWGNTYAPVNYDGKFHGPVSIRQALGSSLNIPAVKTLAIVGLDNMIATAKDLGVTTFTDPSRYGLSLTLGGGEVKMIEMMGVYGAFSQGGKLNKPTGILKVTDSSGNILEEYQKKEKEAISPEVAYLINSVLSDNNARSIAFGVNSLLNITGVGVKTGTTDSKRDNWTFGYTPDFVVGVWVGNNDNSPMDPRLTSGITGAAPIWNKITNLLLQTHPNLGFARPAGITQVYVDGRSDLIVSGTTPKGLVSIKKGDNKTIFSDAFSSYATPSAVTKLQPEQTAIKNESTN